MSSLQSSALARVKPSATLAVTAQVHSPAPGPQAELQASVLSWMGRDARRIYANGGFANPHLGITVDEPVAVPGANVPRLGGAALTGDLLAHFYTSTVDALITLGDRQSVSNAEDRWLRFKEAGWLLFSIALRLLLLQCALFPLQRLHVIAGS